jgi:UDP-3-O-[3-hydroxymyristoyl] glucosamine N-acyltransferase
MTHTPPRKNSELSKSLQLKKLAELVGGELVGDASVTITGVAGIKEARSGDITFLANPKYAALLEQTQASAVITFHDTVSRTKPLVRTPNPSLAFSKVVSFFTPSKPEKIPGVHPTAVVDPSVKLGAGVSVGPHVVIEKDTKIGDRTVIEAGSFIGSRCMIGSQAWIYPNVTIREETEIGDRVVLHSGAVIGADGFGYETVDGAHVKIPQTGSVKIEEDVEIGANVCVDRGRFQKTWIKKGTKIDNLVQVAHNVVIGENCLVVSQTGISGSAELGRNVIVAGQAGIIGHVKIEDGAIVGARAGVNKPVPANTIVLGEPARPIMEQKKLFALIGRLPELFRDVLELKKKLP